MKKALVTGASGFTGFHLAKTLHDRGYEVYGLVRAPERGKDLEAAGIQLRIGDVTNAAAMDAAVAGMDVVYHLAASYREAAAMKDRLYATNVVGTQHVMDACLKHRVSRVVHCSTAGVHGEVQNPPATESAPFAPGDIYQETKTQGELLVTQTYVPKGLPVVIFRPVGLYGPGDHRFLKLFKSIANHRFIMFGNGEVLYHLSYISDIIDGVIACGEKPGIEGEIFLLCGPRATTLNELVQKVSASVGGKPPWMHLPFAALWIPSVICEAVCTPFGISPPLFRRRANWFKKDRAFDCSKAQQILGYNPRVDLEEGLARTAAWYRAEKLIP